MNNVLMGLQSIKCFVYVDDIVIYGYDLRNHNSKLLRLRLHQHNLKLQPEKCNFIKRELNYLGHIISEDGLKPDPSKINSVKSFPRPQKPKDIKSFLGLAGYYRRFIANFAQTAKPLTRLLKKNVQFKWDAFCEEAFVTLKTKLTTPPVLIYPDFSKTFIITTDASDYALGAVLSQGEIGEDKPICYVSRTLNSAETRYPTSEKELLAIVYAVKQFRPYVYGKKFIIITDHKPLRWLMTLQNPCSRLMRWKIILEEYDYTIIYKPGKYNANADALSRIIPDEMKEIAVITRSKAKGDICENQGNKQNPVIIPHNNFESDPKILNESLSILDKHPIKTLFIILPPINTSVEEKLKLQSKDFVSPEVGNTTRLFLGNSQKDIIVTKVKFPLRTQNDKVELSKVMSQISNECKQKNLNIIGLSIPIYDPSTEIEIKQLLSESFQFPIEIHLFKDTRTCLTSPEDINQVINDYHTSSLGGHQGISRTIKKLRKDYYWSSMLKDVKNFIKKCESCQKNKLQRNPHIPIKITTTSSRPFERIALDIVGPLPNSYKNNKYLLTFQDDLTKFSEAVPLESTEADTVARAFIENIVCRHGLPEAILTDQGTNFLSNLFKEVCKLMKTRKINTTPYHPQTNGALERSHRTLSEYLRHYVNKDSLSWDTWIPYAMFVYNTTPHSSTDHSPYELLYGYPPKVPNSLKTNPQVSYNYDNYANELKARLQHGYQMARQKIQENKDRAKVHYDKNSRSKVFNVGDKILLKSHLRKDKFSPLWEGPYEVIKVLSEQNTIIKIKNKNKTVHNNNIKPFIE